MLYIAVRIQTFKLEKRFLHSMRFSICMRWPFRSWFSLVAMNFVSILPISVAMKYSRDQVITMYYDDLDLLISASLISYAMLGARWRRLRFVYWRQFRMYIILYDLSTTTGLPSGLCLYVNSGYFLFTRKQSILTILTKLRLKLTSVQCSAKLQYSLAFLAVAFRKNSTDNLIALSLKTPPATVIRRENAFIWPHIRHSRSNTPGACKNCCI